MPTASYWNKLIGVLWLLFSIASSRSWAVGGILKEKGTRKPLVGVTIYLVPDETSKQVPLKALTDSEGRFHLDETPGSFKWVVVLPGYEKLEEVGDKNEGLTILYLEKTSYQVYETTVTGKVEKREDVKTLRRSQFLRLPGSNGDPIRSIQNLPGVNRPSPIQSQVIIQGSSPRDTRYTIDGHEVPIIFHFGGLSSVTFPDALDRVDYLSAGYGPEFGRAMGGLVGVWTRAPETDRFHGLAFLDVFNTGLLLEGPVSEKSSFLIGARRSYIGEVLGAFAKGNKDFNLTVAPSSSDLITLYENTLTDRDQLKLVGVGSIDSLEFILNQPAGQSLSLRGNFSNRTRFFRIIPQLAHTHSARTISRYSLGFGRDWTGFELGANDLKIFLYALSSRMELERRFTPSWTAFWGFDHRFTWADVTFTLPSNSLQSGIAQGSTNEEDRLTGNIKQFSQQLGFYWRNQVKPEGTPWTFMPNSRLDYFSLVKQWLFQPRLAIRYSISESLTARTAGGLYAQPPQEQDVSVEFGNPDLKAPRAWHLYSGFEKDFREGGSRGWILTSGAFYRYFDQLVAPSRSLITRNGTLVPERFNNAGSGSAFGIENLVRMELKPWTGWLSYTLSRSTRSDPLQGSYLFRYDQTHILTAISSYEAAHHWTFSTRLRYVTGNPTTPIASAVFDSDQDRYLPIAGPYFSSRLSPFVQLDARIDKKWIYRHWILSAYLDVQNITNRTNVEAIQYAYNYASTAQVSGLPILPTFGLKGEF